MMVIRFFFTVFAIYLALTLLRIVIRVLRGNPSPSQSQPPEQNSPKPKEEYKDVKDAKFTELPGKQPPEKSSEKNS